MYEEPLVEVTMCKALQNTCVLESPSELLNKAFEYAKDNIASCMRYYSLGWGMSNNPKIWTLVVGRDTGWMSLGADYVASWFAPEALKVFRDRQMDNGKILEFINMENGESADYGYNVLDNTPLYLWGICHHWDLTGDENFREAFLPSVKKACDYLLTEIDSEGLVYARPYGHGMPGMCTWRNVVPDGILGGYVTEINSLTSMALHLSAEFADCKEYATAAHRIAEAINTKLWNGNGYLLTEYEGKKDCQITSDMMFPVLCGIATPEKARQVFERLSQKDFWNGRGMRTIPNTEPGYEPNKHFGVLGGVWPNPTLWYAASIALQDPDETLKIIEMVAKSVVELQGADDNITQGEFPEWFDGETGVNGGMHLSPWVGPTFVWAVMEGLLGMSWKRGKVTCSPRWPSSWDQVKVSSLLTGDGKVDIVLNK